MNNELETKVEEIKQDEDVKRALKQATPVETEEEPARARVRDKLVIGTHVALFVVLVAVHQIVNYQFPGFFQRYTIIEKFLIAVNVGVVCLMVLRLIEVYF